MNKPKQNISTIVITFLILFGFSYAKASDPKFVIRFATEATYPPFEYTDNTGKIEGFDIDIAKALCKELKAECTFANQSFNSLIPSLKLGKFDAIIGALSITKAREKEVSFTKSYYQPSAAFVGEKTAHLSLARIAGKRIGAQQGTTFEQLLLDTYGKKINTRTYASIEDAFLDLYAGRLDMVLSDFPIIHAWLSQGNNELGYMQIGKAMTNHTYVGIGYGIAVRKSNTELLAAFNSALEKIKENRTYQKIIDKHFKTIVSANTFDYTGALIKGTVVTLELALYSLVLGLMIGMAGALFEAIPFYFVRVLCMGFIQMVRGLPELLVLFFIYFGITAISSNLFNNAINLTPFVAGVSALSIIFGAYASQVFRGAFASVDPGQLEAGAALGFSRRAIFFRILLPQGLRHALPGLGNLWLVLLKDTAIVSLIGLTDMMTEAKLAASATHKPFTFYLMAAFIYLLITTLSQIVIHYMTICVNRYV